MAPKLTVPLNRKVLRKEDRRPTEPLPTGMPSCKGCAKAMAAENRATCKGDPKSGTAADWLTSRKGNAKVQELTNGSFREERPDESQAVSDRSTFRKGWRRNRQSR